MYQLYQVVEKLLARDDDDFFRVVAQPRSQRNNQILIEADRGHDQRDIPTGHIHWIV